MDDRRGCLAGSGAADLALRRERDARDPRAAVAGGFTDEQDRRVCACVEIARQALREPVVAVLVERVADSRRGEPVYQRSQWTTSSRERRIWVMRLVARLAFGSALPFPTVTPATT